MSISQSDISVLIPTFRYRDKVVRAVRSALDSSAGEIIVVDDRGQDGTLEALKQFSDRRLIVLENEKNLGLWENHLKALGLATRPWIKFIQADDYLLPDGLEKYAALAGSEVTVLSGLPIITNDDTSEISLIYTASRPHVLDWPVFEYACHLFGWFLGSPSYMMFRADALTRDPAVWRNEMSADLVTGALAAAKGKVVIVPPGAIGHGAHDMQDARTQSATLSMQRAANSLAYLRATGDERLQRLADAWTSLNLKPSIRTLTRGLVRGEKPAGPLISAAWLYFADPGLRGWNRILFGGSKSVRDAVRYRKTHRPPFELDTVFSPTTIPGGSHDHGSAPDA